MAGGSLRRCSGSHTPRRALGTSTEATESWDSRSLIAGTGRGSIIPKYDSDPTGRIGSSGEPRTFSRSSPCCPRVVGPRETKRRTLRVAPLELEPAWKLRKLKLNVSP